MILPSFSPICSPLRIIYIHQFFNFPEEGGSLRSYHIAKGLVEAGWQVDILTTHNQARTTALQRQGLKVHYLPIFYDNRLGRRKRIKAFFSFVARSLVYLARLPRPDACFATSTPLTVGLLALYLRAFRGVPYVFEVRDLWPEAPIQLGFVRNRLYARALQCLEAALYNRARAVVALSPPMEAGVREKLKKPVPVYCIPNFADTAFFQQKPAQAPQPDAALRVVYVGTFGFANRLEKLLAFAAYAERHGLPLEFALAGSGQAEANLRQQAAELGNVRFLGFHNREGVRQVLAGGHLAYVSFADYPILGSNSPNKFFDALAAGCPVIANVEGWVADLIREHQCGLLHLQGRHRQLADALLKLRAEPQNWQQMSQNALGLAHEQFERQKLTQAAVRVLGEALTPRSRPQ